MFNRIVIALVFIPLAVILIALAVANRAAVPFTLDPFNPGNPALSVELPLFVYLFAAIVIGMIVGSIATWFRQGRYRRIARERTQEVERLREAERQRSRAVASPTDL
ncbi:MULTISPECIES: lipopolysaccharide assembly protein LapA domain-containing protein [Phyllobacteriaceae]|uniref:lipopolysaccharide assembly protein LapA domain-containing protein n=1 Tax=Phyllobacteriaceae TaxID=69277 RepID=UPI002ACA8BE2|nr:lipopolysaccharide assembly protein LapA domain-containing protein [Chelativorans sp. M5D2P16]MDZ5697195.1 lipopolysaccharide assembly protein LapA domain-containing protein [Chelativorans sp. M5D2P16]